MLKLLALIAGAAGVAGFFLPLAEYTDATGAILQSASAYDIARTQTDPNSIADFARGLGVSDAQAREFAERAQQGLLAHRGTIIAFYIPAALQALLALINLLRSRMGRISGFLALLLGAANAAVFVFFYIGDQRNADASTDIGWGVWALAAAGAGGMIAGLLALFLPDDD